ncbi:CRISPR-associated protein Cas4 [Agathobacter sp.]|uniref:CRISPR-associated protein Cas4 n=1 Tax=Agathobacter sp. TaxID=2021311 RepID=UPI00280A92F1|nr:CRISPR-associated protein Cas4 [Agathobacter sp.]
MDERITGVMIYYYFICKRKLWYFCHQINMEDNNENVQLGKLLDENSYKRDDKHIQIDGVINIDFIHDNRELHEIKKSRAVEEAGIWQLKYYLYYLEERGVKGIKGRIDYPLLKRTMEVALSDEDRNVLGDVIKDINILKKQNMVPQLDKKKICSKCAYYDLCYI